MVQDFFHQPYQCCFGQLFLSNLLVLYVLISLGVTKDLLRWCYRPCCLGVQLGGVFDRIGEKSRTNWWIATSRWEILPWILMLVRCTRIASFQQLTGVGLGFWTALCLTKELLIVLCVDPQILMALPLSMCSLFSKIFNTTLYHIYFTLN